MASWSRDRQEAGTGYQHDRRAHALSRQHRSDTGSRIRSPAMSLETGRAHRPAPSVHRRTRRVDRQRRPTPGRGRATHTRVERRLAMTSLTRWVLAHKRIVVIVAVALTLVGMASAGSATKAMKQKFSVPGKEGWVTNQQIERDFHGTGGNRA